MLARLALILLWFSGFAQHQFRFSHFGLKNGLSQNAVYATLKDSEGYYWLGTQDGLNRFDGYSVKIFRREANDSSSLSDNFITCLKEDRNGQIWVGTRNGLSVYNKRSGRFHRLIVYPDEKKEYHNNIWNIVFDDSGNVYFSNRFYEIVRIDADDAAAAPFHPRSYLKDAVVYDISKNFYATGSEKKSSLQIYGKANNRLLRTAKLASPGTQLPICEGDSGKFIFSAPEGIVVTYSDQPSRLLHPLFEKKSATFLFYDSRKNLWIGTPNGLYVMPYFAPNTPVLLRHIADDPSTPASNFFVSAYEDNDGLIWLGGAEGGANIYNPALDAFRIFNLRSSVPMPDNSIWAVYQHKNDLWVSALYGLTHLTLSNNKVCGLYDGSNEVLDREIVIPDPKNKNVNGSNMVTALTMDIRGNLWVGLRGSGLAVKDAAGKWKYFNKHNSPLLSQTVFHLNAASDGKVWVSTPQGFYYYEPESESVKSPGDGNFLARQYVMSSYEDSRKNIWAATSEGFACIKKTGEENIYPFDKTSEKGLAYSIVTTFLEDSKGRFWVATMGGGLHLMNIAEGTLKAYNEKDGLSNAVVYCMHEDRKGRIWMSTNAGITCLDPDRMRFINYTEKDGIPSKEFTSNVSFMNAAGEIFFGCTEGLLAFDPGKIKENNKPVPVILSGLRINYEDRNYIAGDEINLYYGDQTVTFEFTAPDFAEQEKIRYEFRLEGFDDKWHEVPATGRLASFTNLPYGSYVFKVRVRKDNMDWQERQLEIRINAIPPFWMKPWFIASEIVLGLAIVILLVRYYSQRKYKIRLREAEMQQKIHLERERISRDLHDNVGSHLTYIISSLDNISYTLEEKEEDPQVEKLSSLSDFARSTMQQLRETIWAINSKEVTLEELKGKVSEYAHRMSEAGNMLFSLDYVNGAPVVLKPSQAIHLYRVVQEIINNAVKHSGAMQLHMRISCSDGILYMELKDDGKGIEESAVAKGYGLKNLRVRVEEEMKGKLIIGKAEGGGTKIRITVPAGGQD